MNQHLKKCQGLTPNISQAEPAHPITDYHLPVAWADDVHTAPGAPSTSENGAPSSPTPPDHSLSRGDGDQIFTTGLTTCPLSSPSPTTLAAKQASLVAERSTVSPTGEEEAAMPHPTQPPSSQQRARQIYELWAGSFGSCYSPLDLEVALERCCRLPHQSIVGYGAYSFFACTTPPAEAPASARGTETAIPTLAASPSEAKIKQRGGQQNSEIV